MEHYEEILKLLHDQFDWKLTDSLTTTGKKLVADTIKALKIAENNQALQLQQTGVSGSDIFQAVDEAMSLIDYMHQITVIPDNIVEDYANRFANTMHLLAEVRHHYR